MRDRRVRAPGAWVRAASPSSRLDEILRLRADQSRLSPVGAASRVSELVISNEPLFVASTEEVYTLLLL